MRRGPTRQNPQHGQGSEAWLQAGRRGLALGLGLAILSPGAGRCRDDFGRWQGSLQECRIQIQGQRGWSCQRLEIVQTSDQVLSLRFLRLPDQRKDQQRLQLIGLVTNGEGLDCSPNGCALTPQLHLLVTGLSHLQFDGRGLALTTPIGTTASGHCQWQQRQLRCSIQTGRGPNWTIQARL